MRVLITGGCGFVGAFAALELTDHGHEVVCYDRRAVSTDVLERAAKSGRVLAVAEGDIRDRDRLVEARAQQGADLEGEINRLRQENERTRQEAAAKVAQLNERIKDLNQRLSGGAPSPSGAAPGGPPPQSGFFKR